MMGTIGKGIRFLKGIRDEINNLSDNLSFIRRNPERMVQVAQYEALLHDPIVRDYLSELRSLMTVKDVQGGYYCRIGCQDNSGGYIMLDDLKIKRLFAVLVYLAMCHGILIRRRFWIKRFSCMITP